MSSHDSYGHGRGQPRDRETSGTNPDSSPALGRGHGRGRSTSISVYNSGPTQVDPRLSDKSLNELVNEGLQAKLLHMPQAARNRLQVTLERIINEGCDGLICILL